MISKIITRAACLAERASNPIPSRIVQTCTVVFRTCQELRVPKETIALLDWASVEYLHVNNPIPKVPNLVR
jgi:hypothetical protein